MSDTCIYLGHKLGDWQWMSGCDNCYIPGMGNIGPVHSEMRLCETCREQEWKYDLPGKFSENMSKERKEALNKYYEKLNNSDGY